MKPIFTLSKQEGCPPPCTASGWRGPWHGGEHPQHVPRVPGPQRERRHHPVLQGHGRSPPCQGPRHPDHPVRGGAGRQVQEAPGHPDARQQDQVPPALQGEQAGRRHDQGQQAQHLLPVEGPAYCLACLGINLADIKK